MKISIGTFVIILFLAGCSMSKSQKVFPEVFDAIAQRGNSGRAEGNRWVTFQVKLLRAPENLIADTLWINNIALPIELTRVGDTTFLNTLYYGMAPGTDEPLVADKSYSGKARLLFSENEEMLKISKFRIIEPLIYP